MRRFLLVESLLITVPEIYKQINFSFHVDGSQILFDYQWYAFPFSVLIYVAGFTAASGIIMLLCKVFHISSTTSLSHQAHTPKLRRLPATH